MICELPKPSATEDTSPKGSGRAIDIPGAVLRHWKAGVLASLVVIAAGIPYAWAKGASKWRVEGVIYVSPRFQRNLDTDPEHEIQSNSQYREFVQQQVKTLTRFDIVQQALQTEPALRHWKKPGESERRAVDRLRSSLQVVPVADTYQVTVGLSGDEPGGLAEITNAVMKSYVGRMRTELMFDSDDRLRHLDAEKEELAEKIGALIEQRSRIAQQLGTTVFTEGMINSFDRMMGTSSEAVVEARRQRLLAEAGVSGRGPAAEPGEGTQAEALEKALNDSGLASLKTALNLRKAELMTRMNGLSPQHSGRIAAAKEIQQIDDEIEHLTQTLRTRLAANLETLRRDRLQQAEKVERELHNADGKIRSQAEEYSRSYQQNIEIGNEVERARKRLTAIEDRMSYLRLETQAPGWVRIFSPAMRPDLPAQGGRKKLLMLVFVAAGVLGLAIPAGLDFLDPRVRALGELEAQLGLPVAACFPYNSGKERLDSQAVLRAAVSMRRHLGELRHRAIAVTAVSHGGGSSTFTLAVAAALNRLGVNTLVVEANPLTPDSRYLAGSAGDGVIQWLDGISQFDTCCRGAQGEFPDRIPTGDGCVEDLLPVERLLRKTEEPCRPYDLVLVDAAPLTKSLATEELIRVTGSVLLVVNARKDSRAAVKECMTRLRRLAPAAFGAVLNKTTQATRFLSRRQKSDDSPAVLAA